MSRWQCVAVAPVAEELLDAEFDRQIQNLLQRGYPGHVGLSDEEFADTLQPLRAKLGTLPSLPTDATDDRVPFVIVVTSSWVATEAALHLAGPDGQTGHTVLEPAAPCGSRVGAGIGQA